MDGTQKGSSYSVRRAVSNNPGKAAALLAVLVIVVLVLAFYVARYKNKCSKSGFEGLACAPACPQSASCRSAPHGGPCPRAPCGPGETPVTYHNPDGSAMAYCRSSDVLPGPPTVCGVGWDPAASAEAEALATVGSLQHHSYGERRLQRAVDAAYDSNVGMSDCDLETLMHQGGTP